MIEISKNKYSDILVSFSSFVPQIGLKYSLVFNEPKLKIFKNCHWVTNKGTLILCAFKVKICQFLGRFVYFLNNSLWQKKGIPKEWNAPKHDPNFYVDKNVSRALPEITKLNC